MDRSPVRLGERTSAAYRPAVAGEHELDLEPVDHVEAREELAGGIGRVAEVVVERDAPEQMVSGQQQPALGLVKADVRGCVARRLVHLPGAQVRLHLHARQELDRGQDHAGDPVPLAAARLRVRRQRAVGHARPARQLDAALEGGCRVGRRRRHVPVVRVHPQLAPRPLYDRRRLAVVVRVGVRADQEAHLLEREPGLVESQLEPRAGSPARAARCRPAPRRRRRRSRRRCRAAPRARAAAAAGAIARAARDRPGRAHARRPLTRRAPRG